MNVFIINLKQLLMIQFTEKLSVEIDQTLLHINEKEVDVVKKGKRSNLLIGKCV